MELKINGSVKDKSMNFHNNEDGSRQIHATFKVVGTDIEFSVNALQPKGDTKMAESFLKAHLIESGAFTE